jgi:hypothetical protein
MTGDQPGEADELDDVVWRWRKTDPAFDAAWRAADRSWSWRLWLRWRAASPRARRRVWWLGLAASAWTAAGLAAAAALGAGPWVSGAAGLAWAGACVCAARLLGGRH